MQFKKIVYPLIIFSLFLTACQDKTQTVSPTSAISVTTYTAGAMELKTSVSYTGEIKAADSAFVTSMVSAAVETVYAEEGQFVHAGDLLLQLDSSTYRLAYNQAQAAYQSAQSGVESANAAVGSASAGKESAEASQNSLQGSQEVNLLSQKQAVDAAQAEYNNAKTEYERQLTMYENDTNLVAAKNARDLAESTYERMKSLYDLGSISRMELDNAKINYENADAAVVAAENSLASALDAAKTRLENAERNLTAARSAYDLQVSTLNPDAQVSAKAGVNSAEAGITSAQAGVRAAEAGVASAKAALDIAADNLNHTRITAPIDGYISMKNVTKGQMVSAGMTVFEIKNVNLMNAQIHVTESVISHISTDTQAEISVTAANVSGIKGKITAVNSTKDAATGLYSVKIALDNKDGKIKDGMFASVLLITDAIHAEPVVPAASVLYDENDRAYVFVAKDSVATKRDIEVGLSDGQYTQVISGLSKGEQVVVSGKDFLIADTHNAISVISEE